MSLIYYLCAPFTSQNCTHTPCCNKQVMRLVEYCTTCAMRHSTCCLGARCAAKLIQLSDTARPSDRIAAYSVLYTECTHQKLPHQFDHFPHGARYLSNGTLCCYIHINLHPILFFVRLHFLSLLPNSSLSFL